MHRSRSSPILRAALGALVVGLGASAALAAGLSGEQAAKERHDHMKALGAAAKALSDQMKSPAPDKAVVKAQADKIAQAGRDLPTWFPAGSGKEAYPKSRALPLIWSDAAAFAAAGRKLADASATLAGAADAGDIAAVGAQMNAVGGACKGCHDKFRGPET